MLRQICSDIHWLSSTRVVDHYYKSISYWKIWMTIQCVLQCSIIIFIPIQSLTWWFHFYCYLYIDRENVKRGRVQGDIQQLRNFKHKGKNKIGCYARSVLIFTDYQAQEWWTMIISPLKTQPYGSNVTEILLKSSWHTHLKYSNPYILILQITKKPPDGFFTHLLFASTIILIFGGLFSHRISRLIKVNINCLSVPTTESERQKIRTRRENPKPSKPRLKARNKSPKGHTKNRLFVFLKFSKDKICHILYSRL